MRIQKKLINVLFGFALVSISTSAFGIVGGSPNESSFIHIGQVFCNVHLQAIKSNNVIEYTKENFHSFPMVSSNNDDTKPINYAKIYEACFKKYNEGSFSIDQIPILDDPDTLNSFMEKIKIINHLKLEDFLKTSEDSFSNFVLFQKDAPRALDTYIISGQLDTNKITTPKFDTSMALFSPKNSTWKGSAVFKQTGADVANNDIPNTAPDTVSYMANALSAKLGPQTKGFSNQLSENLAKFIVITANQGSFDGLINSLFFTTPTNSQLVLLPDFTNDTRANYYQINSKTMSNKTIDVVYTQMMEFTKIRKMTFTPSSKVTEVLLNSPVTVAVSIAFELENKNNQLYVAIDHTKYKVTVSGRNSDDTKLMRAIMKGGMISTDPGEANKKSTHTVAEKKNMVLVDF